MRSGAKKDAGHWHKSGAKEIATWHFGPRESLNFCKALHEPAGTRPGMAAQGADSVPENW